MCGGWGQTEQSLECGDSRSEEEVQETWFLWVSCHQTSLVFLTGYSIRTFTLYIFFSTHTCTCTPPHCLIPINSVVKGSKIIVNYYIYLFWPSSAYFKIKCVAKTWPLFMLLFCLASPLKKGEKNNIWSWPLFQVQLPVTCGDKDGLLDRKQMAKGHWNSRLWKKLFVPRTYWKLPVFPPLSPLRTEVHHGQWWMDDSPWIWAFCWEAELQKMEVDY